MVDIIDKIVEAITARFRDEQAQNAIRAAERNPTLSEEDRQRVRQSDNPSETLREVVQAEDEETARGRGEDLVEEFVGGFFDTFEDDVLENIEDGETLKPENIEGKINEAEGAALEDALGVLAALLGIELAGGTQLETHEETITQIATFLTLEDVLGRRLGMAYEKGVDPALEAEIGKQTRSEFVNLQDAIEYALRNKTNDDEFLTASGAPQDVVDLIGSNEPVNRENLVEEWGIRDDQLDILEAVSLEQIEFEELIETPAELGKIVPDEILEAELDRAGYAEDTKEFLSSVNDEIGRSNRVWEEKTAVESLVSQLDTLVDDGELSPAEAVDLLPDEADTAREALRDRFDNIQGLPGGAPTRSLVETSFAQGYTDLATLQNRLDRLEFDTDEYDDVVRTVVRDEIDGDLQQAFALGFIDQGTYGEYMDFIGLDQETQAALFAGQDLGTVADSRLQEDAPAGERPVGALPGIGESRATALGTIGIETLADLATADPQQVADTAQVSPETAQDLIQLAQQAV